ncbi:Fic family protein [Gilvimarinus sp. F26214L]|uniref:Fic family protein n=1 Tax=Gilvimarinus sp. DZF01 TaxID=3461371 RepID=UPI0040460A4A
MKQPKVTIGQDIVKLVAGIDHFNKEWKAAKLLPPDHLERLRHTAFLESVGASSRIAGATLTNSQVATLLSDRELPGERAALDHDQRLVVGYAEALDRVLKDHRELHLTTENVQKLHRLLVRNSETGIGDPQKHVKLKGLEDLLQWTAAALDQATMHPLLLIAIFNVALMAVEPFEEGNGRLSRLLTNLLLLRSGYDYLPYTSLEAVIEKNKDYFYKALRNTRSVLEDDSDNWQPWFTFFLNHLKLQQANLAPAMEPIEGTDSEEFSELSMDILLHLSKRGELSLAKIMELTKADQSALEQGLRELVKRGHVQNRGEGRYALAH